MEMELPSELSPLKQKIDELAVARGWSTEGYYFDDSPFTGFHLVKDGSFWKLYWQEPGVIFPVEHRFGNLAEASQEMIKVVTEMKTQGSGEIPRSETEYFYTLDKSETDLNRKNSGSESEQSEEGSPDGLLSLAALLMLVLPWLLVGLPILIALIYFIAMPSR